MNSKKVYKIGYTSGVFDMFHIGHLNILKKAKDQCETLIVGVTTDNLCYERKKKYPIIKEQDRADIVLSIKYVDEVIFQSNMDKINVVKDLGANVVFVGSDWQGTPSWEKYEQDFHEIGVDVVYLPHTDGISSTILRKLIEAPN